MAKKFSIDTMTNPVDVEKIKNSKSKAYINNFTKAENGIVRNIALSEIDDFPGHPFKVLNNEDMDALVESVKENGVLTPISVREKANGRYELISGHRRRRACQLADVAEIPAIIVEMTEEQATIAMVDANLQREKILPSEKAFAYKMKLEAMKRQGKRSDLTSSQLGTKLNEGRADKELAEKTGDSKNTIHRYIRLTYLVPELLDKVDSEELPFMVAVDISYLAIEKQYAVLDYIKKGKVPNLKQSAELKQLGNLGMLNTDAIYRVFNSYRVPRESVGLKSVPHLNTSVSSVELTFVPSENENLEESNAPFMQLNIDGEEVAPTTKKEAISQLVSKLKKKHEVPEEIPNWTCEENQTMKGYILKAVDLWNEENPSEQISRTMLDHLFLALRWATDDMTAEEAYHYYERKK